MTKTQIVQIATPILVPLLIAGLKWFWPRIPKPVLPILCPVLGAVFDLLSSGTLGTGTVWGAALGSVGNNLREIFDQLSGNAKGTGTTTNTTSTTVSMMLVGLLSFSLVGCAMVTQRADTDKDGKHSKVVGYTVFQSAQTLEKAQAQNGGEVQRVGMSGLDQKTDAGTVLAGVLGQVLQAYMGQQGLRVGTAGATVSAPSLVYAPDGTYTATDENGKVLGTFVCVGGNCVRYQPSATTTNK